MKKFWENHSILILLGFVWIFLAVCSWFLGLPDWLSEQEKDRKSTALWPGYWRVWATRMSDSWVADAFGNVLLIALGIKWWDKTSKA